MKKISSKNKAPISDEVRPEYDFKAMKGGVRGKYFKAYRAGHSVEIEKADGATVTQHYKLADGAVVLAPDVRRFFPDSDSVNEALRCLIPILTKSRKKKTRV